MKGLICSFHDNDVDKLLIHNVDFYNMERTKYRLKALSEPGSNSILQKNIISATKIFMQTEKSKTIIF